MTEAIVLIGFLAFVLVMFVAEALCKAAARPTPRMVGVDYDESEVHECKWDECKLCDLSDVCNGR